MAGLNQVISRYREIHAQVARLGDVEVRYQAPVSLLQVTEPASQLKVRIGSEIERLKELTSMSAGDAAQILLWLDGLERDVRSARSVSPPPESTQGWGPIFGGLALVAAAMFFAG
jgi:hypothetical protein